MSENLNGLQSCWAVWMLGVGLSSFFQDVAINTNLLSGLESGLTFDKNEQNEHQAPQNLPIIDLKIDL